MRSRILLAILILFLISISGVNALSNHFPWFGHQDVFFGNASSDINDYKIIDQVPERDIQHMLISPPFDSSTGEVLLGNWIIPIDTLDTNILAPGLWRFRIYSHASTSSGLTKLHFYAINRSSSGTETDLFFGQAILLDIERGDIPAEYLLSYARKNYTKFFENDRLVIKINASTDNANSRTITIDLGGNTNASMVSIGYFTSPVIVDETLIFYNPTTDVKPEHVQIIKEFWWIPAMTLGMIYIFGRR